MIGLPSLDKFSRLKTSLAQRAGTLDCCALHSFSDGGGEYKERFRANDGFCIKRPVCVLKSADKISTF